MEKSEVNLKHLGFVRVLAINTAVLVSNLCDYAKQNSGPLRSTVGTVENAVTTVVKPVYERLKGVPDEVLVFLDKKVLIFTFIMLIVVFIPYVLTMYYDNLRVTRDIIITGKLFL